MKILGIVVAVLVVIAALVFVFGGSNKGAEISQPLTTEEGATNEAQIKVLVVDGEYAVLAEESVIRWAGKKPLIDGYVNSGSLALSSGMISVGSAAITGELVIDMNTLSVSETPTKPGMESSLEGHLKGERWFNVAEFPAATFTLTEMVPLADVESSFAYEVTGTLTMKGVSHELVFPAQVYQEADGRVRATASLEFDRTLWGITAGSGSFFDNLADNVVDDRVALSFELVAERALD